MIRLETAEDLQMPLISAADSMEPQCPNRHGEFCCYGLSFGDRDTQPWGVGDVAYFPENAAVPGRQSNFNSCYYCKFQVLILNDGISFELI